MLGYIIKTERRSYLVRVIFGAWVMTRSAFNIEKFGPSIIKLGVGLLALLAMHFFGWTQLLIDRTSEIWAFLLAVVGLFLFVFLVNIPRAAAQLQNEADEKIDELERILDDKEARQKAIDKLWELRKSGVEIRNESVLTDQFFPGWERRFKRWREETLNEARTVSVNLHNWLEILDRMVEPPPDIKAVNPEHRLLLGVSSTILNRLQQYLEGALFQEEKWQ